MDTAKILTTINYKDFTPIDMVYIIEELSDIHGRENIKTTLKSILDFMERWEREQQFSFSFAPGRILVRILIQKN